MSELTKNKIAENLQQAKQEGQLRTEKIKEIVKNAIAQAVSKLKEGSGEIRFLAKDAISATIDTFQEKSVDLKEEIRASLEGVVEGMSSAKQKAISEKQLEIKQLEGSIEAEELNLQKEIDETLIDIQASNVNRSDDLKATIESTINNIRNSEEVSLLQKRYAQLKAQLAVVQANLANRNGVSHEDIKRYLDDAKVWYERAKEDPEVFTEPINQKRAKFEEKLGAAGTALARKERSIKQLLQELWREVIDIFHEK
jgi:hypothetical protein